MEESVDHLLVHCTKTGILWQLVFSLFGIKWVMPDSVKEVLLSWQGNFVGKKEFFFEGLLLYAFCGLFGGGKQEVLGQCGKIGSSFDILLFLTFGVGEGGLK